jgi:hypothetical protein
MLNINENTNIYGNITITEGDVEKQVMNMNTNLSKEGVNFNINFNVVDKDGVTANKAEVQAQIDSFVASVRTKMTELGYLFTI